MKIIMFLFGFGIYEILEFIIYYIIVMYTFEFLYLKPSLH